MKLFKKSKIERLYNKLDKKFNRIFNIHFHLNGSINTFTWSPYLGLKDNKDNEIIIIHRKGKHNNDDLSKQLNDLLWKIIRKDEKNDKTNKNSNRIK